LNARIDEYIYTLTILASRVCTQSLGWLCVSKVGTRAAAKPLDCFNVTLLRRPSSSGARKYCACGRVSTSHAGSHHVTLSLSSGACSHHLPMASTRHVLLTSRKTGAQRTATCNRCVSLRRDAGHITPVHETLSGSPHRASFHNCQSRHQLRCSSSVDGNRDHPKIARARSDIWKS
jgi:hypothetical protein